MDVTSIWSFIADDNARAADVLIDRIDKTADMLAETPLAGRARPELGPRLRSFPVGNYIIFNVPLPDGIEIVRVMNGRQDINSDDMT
jgi:toxin ParE1/3/4